MAKAAPRPVSRPGVGRMALFTLLGFSAGLPFYLFSTVLFLRLTRNGVDLMTISFFAWVALLPTFKFLWAPLLDRYTVPGFGRFWGKRPGWILLSQLGIASSMVALAFADPDRNLALTALWAVALAFWTTTLEVAADAWRIELAPEKSQQAPLVAATLWGYRSAMVAAGSITLIIADGAGWTTAYLVIALGAFLAFPILIATSADLSLPSSNRWSALGAGLLTSAGVLTAMAAIFAGVGSVLLMAAARAGLTSETNITPIVLALSMLPFIVMALAIPRIRRAPRTSRLRSSPAFGPYVDFFWRYGFASLGILAFVSLYRMGDVLALTLSKPLVNSVGYSLTQIGVADGAVALASSIVGVGLGSWAAARWSRGWALAVGAVLAAIGNLSFVWLANQPPAPFVLYAATAADQFGNGFAGAVFVVYLSLLVNPQHPGSQFAFLSAFAFMLPRLLAGASGSIERVIGYDGFFLLTAVLSLAAIALLPLVARPRLLEEGESTSNSPDISDRCVTNS